MRKIVVASDSFKGSLTSRQVGEAIAEGIHKVSSGILCDIQAVADGGEGTVDALTSALGGELVKVSVTGPLGNPVEACYGMCGDTAVIEMSAAGGITLIEKEKRNPWLTTSFGTGELIRDAFGKGCRKFLIGIGGSATNDAGVGMLQALGFRFKDREGDEVGYGGGETGRIASIDFSEVIPGLMDAEFIVACDVSNPLTGPEGASRIFGPQKGADADMVERLDASLRSFAGVVSGYVGADRSMYPGAGAAGGLGFAFLSFLGARLERGVEMVLEAVDFDSKLAGADLVITGEGSLDRQTCMGKTPFGVLLHARKYGIPVIAIGGRVEPEAVDVLREAGFAEVCAVMPEGMELREAMRYDVAVGNIERAVIRLMRNLKF